MPELAATPRSENGSRTPDIKRQVMIVTFHGVGPPLRPLMPGEATVWLEHGHFQALLDELAVLPNVELTFDDGNASDVKIALLELLARSMTATFFVSTDLIGDNGYLTRDDIRTLAGEGMRIGSHGARHLDWRSLRSDALRRELSRSSASLHSILGRYPVAVACPFGSYDRRVLRLVSAAGFKAIYTSDGGPTPEGAWLRGRTTITRYTKAPQLRSAAWTYEHPTRRLVRRVKQTIKRLR